MTVDLDLLSMPKEDLLVLSKKIDKALSDYDARKKAEARAAAEALAKEAGYSLSELMEVGGAKGSKGAPKYAHPENPSKTWTGRGRKPKWVEEHLAAGGDLDTLAIQ
ncbi:H-NS family nucleoid-associated regulatory protein [Salipiger marinus]|uniref:DNA-binding protein H-NS n=1 Tax=Salipiger marinus TaxID=555512 RepID=A0A1G8TFM7_9RHOB|nr:MULTISPECIES: H-NS histone family protein [Salipiger]MEB3421606.1 H-NS histone family protein [Salipiger manganoxidans]SDJ40204.1 DNA-binding protein H-NS [Salipiger marinus]